MTMRFENQTGAADNNYLNNGITENLVTTLSKSELLFIPSSHTRRFVLQNYLTDAEVWSEYGTKYIVKGSVQVSDSRLRISLQMTNTVSNEVISSEIYATQNKFRLQTKGQQVSQLPLYFNHTYTERRGRRVILRLYSGPCGR